LKNRKNNKLSNIKEVIESNIFDKATEIGEHSNRKNNIIVIDIEQQREEEEGQRNTRGYKITEKGKKRREREKDKIMMNKGHKMGGEDINEVEEIEVQDTEGDQDNEIEVSRIPPQGNRAFWNNYESMYKLAVTMEEELAHLDESDPKRPEIVKGGNQLVERLQIKTKMRWDTLKSMEKGLRENFLKNKSNNTMNYRAAVTEKNNEPKRKQVRIRVNFMGKQSQNRSQEKVYELKRLIREVLSIGKGVDAKMKIGSWANNDEGIGLNEVVRMNEAKTLDVVDIPTGTTVLKGMIRGVGIKLYTNISVHKIVRLYAIVNYRNKGRNGLKLTVKECETQIHPKAYPIGYFQGTSSNGDYRTINEQIIKETNGRAEASWQNIYIRGVTGKVWDTANKEALKQGQQGSVEFKRRKFQMAPEGLVVYVPSLKDQKEIKNYMIEKYSKRTVMADGSQTRFIPFANQGTQMSNTMKDKLVKRIKWQCVAKATEEKFPVTIKDIYKPKSYFQGRSLEQVIHGLTIEGTPVFRHIAHRWNNNIGVEEYDLLAHSSMTSHASNIAASLKHHIHEEAEQNPEVFVHFSDGAKNLVEAVHLAEMAEDSSNNDDEVEKYYNNNDDEDDAKELTMISPEFLEILDIKEGQHYPFDDASTMGGSVLPSDVERDDDDTDNEDDNQSMQSNASSVATDRTGGVEWAPNVQDISKKTVEEIINLKLQDQNGMWEKYVRWKENNEVKYDIAIESRSTNVTKAQSVYNLFQKDNKKNKSQATGTAERNPGSNT
jgi:hypothetical protein